MGKRHRLPELLSEQLLFLDHDLLEARMLPLQHIEVVLQLAPGDASRFDDDKSRRPWNHFSTYVMSRTSVSMHSTHREQHGSKESGSLATSNSAATDRGRGRAAPVFEVCEDVLSASKGD